MSKYKKYHSLAHTLCDSDIGHEITKVYNPCTPYGLPDLSYLGDTYILKSLEYETKFKCNRSGCINYTNLVCERCRYTHYCGKECQREEYPLHREICEHDVKENTRKKYGKKFILTATLISKDGSECIIDKTLSDQYFTGWALNTDIKKLDGDNNE